MRKFGHVQRRNNGFMRQRMLKTELPGRRKRKTFVDAVKEGMQRCDRLGC